MRSEEAGENPARSRHCNRPGLWACGSKVRPSFVAYAVFYRTHES